MRRSRSQCTRLAAAGLAVLLAAAPATAKVKTGDTFSFVALAGAQDGTVYRLGDAQLVTFGKTQSFSFYEGQSYTVASSQTRTPTVSTAAFSVSTADGFLIAPTIDGKTITTVSMNFGTPESGAGLPGGRDRIDFVSPMGPYSWTHTWTDNSGTAASTMTGTAPGPAIGFFFFFTSTGGGPISDLGWRSYRSEFTYATAVPEPATWAMMIVGFGLVGGTVRLRGRREQGTVAA